MKHRQEVSDQRLLKAAAWLFLTLVAAISCSDRSGPIDPPPPPELAPDGVVASEPIGSTSTAGPMALVLGEVYVSTSPGTFPNGVSAVVSNTATGQSVTAAIVEGGFDPVVLTGSPGDELEISVSYSDGTSKVYAIPVPETSRPRVVRTRPTRDAADVPLNSIIIVVFSEPMDSTTVTPQELRLDLAGSPVAGALKLAPGDLRAELTPSQPLEPATDYTLEIGADLADRAGEALEAPVTIQFRTLPALKDQIVFIRLPYYYGPPGDPEVFVMNTDGSGVVNLTNHPAHDLGAAVSPDGTRILFTSDRSGDTEIYGMNADGSGVINLSNSPGWEGSASWSPDGAMIAFVRFRDGNARQPTDIFVMNADGSNPVNITNDPLHNDDSPVWSPDGTRIAFRSDKAGVNTSHIYLMDPDGSNLVELGLGFQPGWSPDGTRIAYVDYVSGIFGIHVMNADGSNPVRLTAGQGIVYCDALNPSWSPNSQRIAFRASAWLPDDSCSLDYDVFVMNSDGTNASNLTNTPQFDEYVGSHQAWSP